MMTKDLARALDPVLLARDCGIEPDPWQATLLRERPRRSLLLCSRQSGKSTVTALTAIDTAIYNPGSLILLVSPSQRQSAELFRSLMLLYGKLKDAPALNAETVLRAELANRSRIVALPGSEKTIRGFSAADLVVVDEAARCEDSLLGAVRPMMAVSKGGGRLIMLSTPAGKRGFFFEAWTGDDASWHRTRVPASECPRITQAFLDEELKELGAQRFSEEYSLAFLDPDEAVFSTEIIDRAFDPTVLPLWT
jgi:hypothetical protein